MEEIRVTLVEGFVVGPDEVLIVVVPEGKATAAGIEHLSHALFRKLGAERVQVIVGDVALAKAAR